MVIWSTSPLCKQRASQLHECEGLQTLLKKRALESSEMWFLYFRTSPWICPFLDYVSFLYFPFIFPLLLLCSGSTFELIKMPQFHNLLIGIALQLMLEPTLWQLLALISWPLTSIYRAFIFAKVTVRSRPRQEPADSFGQSSARHSCLMLQ